jgi:hypothetical protein
MSARIPQGGHLKKERMQDTMADTTKNVDQLNSFLRGEISAVETYRQAIDSMKTSEFASALAECKYSHEQRVAILTQQIQRLGGAPAQSSGAWGTFAKLIEGGATTFGEKAAIAALEEGEDHGNADYKRDVPKLEGDARMVVEQEILPLQLRTHANMSALKRKLS